jgi:hypothetical protein
MVNIACDVLSIVFGGGSADIKCMVEIQQPQHPARTREQVKHEIFVLVPPALPPGLSGEAEELSPRLLVAAIV